MRFESLLQAVLYLTYISFTTAFTDNTVCLNVAITANIVMSSVFFTSAVLGIIIPLCPNELRILNPYKGCSVSEIPASFDSAGTSPL